MAEANGKTKIIQMLVGIIVTILIVIILPAMANGIITNDRMSRDRDEKIQSSVVQVKDCVADMKVEIIERLTKIETNQEILKKKLQ